MRILLLCLTPILACALQTQNFVGSFDLVVSHTNSNGTVRGDTISYFFGKEKTALIIHARGKQPDLRLLFNPADSTITGLFEMKGKKGGYILPMDEKNWPGMRTALREYGTGPRKELNYSGDTKEIEGQLAKEIRAESTNYSAVIWMANDIPLNLTSVLAYQSVGAGKDASDIEEFDQFGVEGLPSEVVLKSKIGKGDVMLRVVNLSDAIDASVFSTEGFILSTID